MHFPLGATYDGHGTNFAVFSEHASAIEICLFDSLTGIETERIPLSERTNFIFHKYIPNIMPGQLYGIRAHGAWSPERGHRFNPTKLLIDPYARAIAGQLDYKASIWNETDSFNFHDTAAGVPKCVVINNEFDWNGDRSPTIPWSKTILYEVHVKGFSKLHPDIAPALRGTYLGLCSPAAIDHFKKLGITTIELLPIHASISERFLYKRGLQNYWGYNTLGFFAPDARFSSMGDRGEQVYEFKKMVQTLHAANLEVILDVVFNHTCEGDRTGPTLSFRGLDNTSYYRLLPYDKRQYENCTGCGNALDVRRSIVIQLIMDSLRYWVTEMHVDGFRFDLATTLARDSSYFDAGASLLDAIAQDPILQRCKLIAEPWDLGEQGYQLGNFPISWAEWNNQYRDTIRRLWNQHNPTFREVHNRLLGSPDIFGTQRSSSYASTNYITAHDGFSLHDLVSYNQKQNQQNGEENRDGDNTNYSWNYGVEGSTQDEKITQMRFRQMKNLLATLLISQGVPMIRAGDELAQTQNGNNNAYCQDNELTWLDWNLSNDQKNLLEFIRHTISFRTQSILVQTESMFFNRLTRWFYPNGEPIHIHDWNRTLFAFYCTISAQSHQSTEHTNEFANSIVVLINLNQHSQEFTVPHNQQWKKRIDTALSMPWFESKLEPNNSRIQLSEFSIIVMEQI